MIECLDCKKQLSISANACPHCGCITENKKNRDSNIKKILFFICYSNNHIDSNMGFFYISNQ